MMMQNVRTFGVFNDTRCLAFHDGDSGVGGTQINTDDLALDLLIGIIAHE
jgi:hypothetical protein